MNPSNPLVERENLDSRCLNTFGNEAKQGAMSFVTLDAIVIAKLVCLSEETERRINRTISSRKLSTH